MKQYARVAGLLGVAGLYVHLACAPRDPGVSEAGETSEEDGSSGGAEPTSDDEDASSGSTGNSSSATSEDSTSTGDESTSSSSGEDSTSTTTTSGTSGDGMTTSGETGETSAESESGSVDEPHWVASWGSAQQRLVQSGHLPALPLTDNTVRQFIYTSIGGDEVRLQFSNEYGNGPLTLRAVHLALPTTAPSIDPSTDTAVTFSGAPDATLQPGEFLYSDPVAFALPETSTVAVSIHFGDVPSQITGHSGSRSTSYLTTGDAAAAATFDYPQSTNGAGNPGQGWYFTARLEVMAPSTSGLVVAFGDSLTDGRGSTTNGNNRWPDVLSRRLRMNPETEGVAVINQGIGANGLVADGEGRTAGVDRFERDVLTQAGVRWAVLLMGVNDIGYAGQSADAVIDAYERVIDAAHDAGVKIYGVPLLPFAGWSQANANPSLLETRDTINQWIRTSGRFDAVIDLESAVANPRDPSRLRMDLLFEGDWLHLNAFGYMAMGNAVPLELFVD